MKWNSSLCQRYSKYFSRLLGCDIKQSRWGLEVWQSRLSFHLVPKFQMGLGLGPASSLLIQVHANAPWGNSREWPRIQKDLLAPNFAWAQIDLCNNLGSKAAGGRCLCSLSLNNCLSNKNNFIGGETNKHTKNIDPTRRWWQCSYLATGWQPHTARTLQVALPSSASKKCRGLPMANWDV